MYSLYCVCGTVTVGLFPPRFVKTDGCRLLWLPLLHIDVILHNSWQAASISQPLLPAVRGKNKGCGDILFIHCCCCCCCCFLNSKLRKDYTTDTEEKWFRDQPTSQGLLISLYDKIIFKIIFCLKSGVGREKRQNWCFD